MLRPAAGTQERPFVLPLEPSVYDADGLTMAFAIHGARGRRTAAPLVRGGDRRAAGTGLAGGCTPCRGGVVFSLARMDRIGVHLRDRMAVVEPGVVNLQLSRTVAGAWHLVAPDPSSQGAATIGGNVATECRPDRTRFATVRPFDTSSAWKSSSPAEKSCNLAVPGPRLARSPARSAAAKARWPSSPKSGSV